MTLPTASWNEIRAQFPVTEEYAYFQSAGMSPIPDRVFQTIVEGYSRINRHGDKYWMDDLARTNGLLSRLGDMINTRAENLAFLPNTSFAYNMLALAMRNTPQEPFNMVCLRDEFPSSNIPFAFQGIAMKYVDSRDGVYHPEDIVGAMDENTLAVIASYVQYASGARQDLAAIGKAVKERGGWFIVNATQGFPVYPLDVQAMHIDALSVSFHKWGCCAHVGALLYTSADFRRTFPLPLAGWLSVHPAPNDFIPTQKDCTYQQYEDARQYNFGTQNFQALLGLDAALAFMQEIGFVQIRDRIAELTVYLIAGLKGLPLEIRSPVEDTSVRSGIVMIYIAQKDQAEVVRYLEQRQIITSIRAGCIRISCNFFNNHEDVDRLIDALKGLLVYS